MVEIDGSFGEGGGQILRTSLALSLVTRTPFRMTNIRVKRAKPGLRRQHLTAVRAAARIGKAKLHGAALESTELTFEPGPVSGGDYEFDVGSAGSTTLVFQTVLPALLLCAEPSSVRLKGGTHNHGGPPWDFLQTVFLPLLSRMGAKVTIELATYGFAPAGGGEWTAHVLPSRLHPFELHERGARLSLRVQAIVSNLPKAIAERELDTIASALGQETATYESKAVKSAGPGNIVTITGSHRNITELATGFGQRGVPAEKVATVALECWRAYDESGAPVGEHLADQLLLPLALARGGSFITMKPTLHTTTNLHTISKFLRLRSEIRPEGDTSDTYLLNLETEPGR